MPRSRFSTRVPLDQVRKRCPRNYPNVPLFLWICCIKKINYGFRGASPVLAKVSNFSLAGVCREAVMGRRGDGISSSSARIPSGFPQRLPVKYKPRPIDLTSHHYYFWFQIFAGFRFGVAGGRQLFCFISLSRVALPCQVLEGVLET